jgi:hypothetical protein
MRTAIAGQHPEREDPEEQVVLGPEAVAGEAVGSQGRERDGEDGAGDGDDEAVADGVGVGRALEDDPEVVPGGREGEPWRVGIDQQPWLDRGEDDPEQREGEDRRDRQGWEVPQEATDAVAPSGGAATRPYGGTQGGGGRGDGRHGLPIPGTATTGPVEPGSGSSTASAARRRWLVRVLSRTVASTLIDDDHDPRDGGAHAEAGLLEADVVGGDGEGLGQVAGAALGDELDGLEDLEGVDGPEEQGEQDRRLEERAA